MQQQRCVERRLPVWAKTSVYTSAFRKYRRKYYKAIQQLVVKVYKSSNCVGNKAAKKLPVCATAGSMPAAMDAQAVSALAQRISRDPQLVLPGSMTRPDAPPVSDDGKVQYVSGLLQHDPGVFLERLGDKLDAAELASFEPLRSDYEVRCKLPARFSATVYCPPFMAHCFVEVPRTVSMQRVEHIDCCEQVDFYLRQLQPAVLASPVQQQAADGDGASAGQGSHSDPSRSEPSGCASLLTVTKTRCGDAYSPLCIHGQHPDHLMSAQQQLRRCAQLRRPHLQDTAAVGGHQEPAAGAAAAAAESGRLLQRRRHADTSATAAPPLRRPGDLRSARRAVPIASAIPYTPCSPFGAVRYRDTSKLPPSGTWHLACSISKRRLPYSQRCSHLASQSTARETTPLNCTVCSTVRPLYPWGARAWRPACWRTTTRR